MGAGPFVVGITNERRTPGVQRHVEVAGPLQGLATSAATVPDDVDVGADVVIEAMTDGRVSVTGRVTSPWEAECRRCLDEVWGTVEVAVQEVFERDPGADAETYRLDGDELDLEPMVRDAVLLALPLAPLCGDDCAGPDPADHPVGTGEVDAGEAARDPRWAALDELRFD